MTVARRTKRSTPRFAIPESQGAVIELTDGPGTGPLRTFQIRDISISGISFVLTDEFGEPESGTEYPQATLRFPRTEISGGILVMHTTLEDDGALVCGSLFYPASEEDLMKLKGVVAGFEVARSLS